jgi:CheY-like chemotaxis protein
LRRAGFDASAEFHVASGLTTRLKASPPDAFLVDLSRMPSHGRAVALYILRSRPLRHIPVVFLEGDPAKVEKLRALAPEAAYANWAAVKKAVNDAVRNPRPARLGPPEAYMMQWAKTPLAKKLGLEPGACALLVNPPEGFEEWVKAPDGVEFVDRWAPGVNLIFLFVTGVDQLDLTIVKLLPKIDRRVHLWICWPKLSGRAPSTGLTQSAVLETARFHGFKTSKIASVDSTWCTV